MRPGDEAIELDCAAARLAASRCCDGEGGDDGALERHLAGCPACCEFAEALPSLAQAVRASVAEPDGAALAALAARLLLRAGGQERAGWRGEHGEPPRGRVLRWPRGARFAAGLIGAALVGLPAWALRRGAVDGALAAGTAAATDGVRAAPLVLAESAWLAPLQGVALLPADASLVPWREALGAEGGAR
ncbi:MAG: hypothetical protein JNL90_11840 [Planctomycetes bacterium]|nr:hypothetical protein [Planctomycetota bacterium]